MNIYIVSFVCDNLKWQGWKCFPTLLRAQIFAMTYAVSEFEVKAEQSDFTKGWGNFWGGCLWSRPIYSRLLGNGNIEIIERRLEDEE